MYLPPTRAVKQSRLGANIHATNRRKSMSRSRTFVSTQFGGKKVDLLAAGKELSDSLMHKGPSQSPEADFEEEKSFTPFRTSPNQSPTMDSVEPRDHGVDMTLDAPLRSP